MNRLTQDFARSVLYEVWGNKDLMKVNSFSELHDLCDANMLGDQSLIEHLENDEDNSDLIDVLNEAFDYCDKILKEVDRSLSDSEKMAFYRRTRKG